MYLQKQHWSQQKKSKHTKNVHIYAYITKISIVAKNVKDQVSVYMTDRNIPAKNANKKLFVHTTDKNILANNADNEQVSVCTTNKKISLV